MAAYTAGFMTHVTCRLTAKNRDWLRNPTLGNRAWATFTFFTAIPSYHVAAYSTIHWIELYAYIAV